MDGKTVEFVGRQYLAQSRQLSFAQLSRRAYTDKADIQTYTANQFDYRGRWVGFYVLDGMDKEAVHRRVKQLC